MRDLWNIFYCIVKIYSILINNLTFNASIYSEGEKTIPRKQNPSLPPGWQLLYY